MNRDPQRPTPVDPMAAASFPTLSIIIVSHNARQHLTRCLESIYLAPPATLREIVLVDNASTDGTVSCVRERWPEVQVIDAGSNVGFGAANNLGIRHSTGELLLLLNGDTVVPAGAIDRLVVDLRAHDEVAVAGPRIVDGEGRPELSFGSMVGPLSELRQTSLARTRGLAIVERHVDRLTRTPRRVDWVSGACLLVRRTDAEAAGLFDERYFLYFEDVDFCAAIRKLGRQVRFSPGAEIVHARGASGRTAPEVAAQAYRRSQLAFYAKHHPAWLPLVRAFLAVTGRLPPGA